MNDVDKFWSSKTESNGCWEWTKYKNSKGYGSLTFRKRAIRAHRLAWELTNGPIPEGVMVLHKCDNPSCINPDHLFLGTNDDNMKDCASKGRIRNNSYRGEKSNLVKLTAEKVLEIKRLKGVKSQYEIARQFGVTQGCIGRIHRGLNWGWLHENRL